MGSGYDRLRASRSLVGSIPGRVSFSFLSPSIHFLRGVLGHTLFQENWDGKCIHIALEHRLRERGPGWTWRSAIGASAWTSGAVG